MDNLEKPNSGFYHFGDFTIDIASFRLERLDRPVDLPPRAFDLLIYLIEHRDRVVEKQELFERVWKGSFVTDNALTRAVKEVRSELGDAAGAPKYIQTVHKRGYRFIAAVSVSENESAPVSNNEDDRTIQTGVDQTTFGEPVSNSRRTILRTALILVASVTLLSVAIGFYLLESEKTVRSVAVLSLDNASGNTADEYLSDGITESLINSLSQLPRLKVMPRTTAFRYKGKTIDPQQIGKDLGVDAVITGQVTRQGDDLILQAEMISTADGSQLWGDRHDRKVADIFSLETEIATEIADKLRLKLTGAEQQRLARRYTENAEAYELYLRGRYHLRKLTSQEIQTAISFFQQAISNDPSYALAYVGLADSNRALVMSVDNPSSELFPRGEAAAKQALEIDPNLADAHAALGFALIYHDWDWTAAEEHLRRALEIDPNTSEARLAYAGLLATERRFPECLAEIGRARDLDPLDLRASALEGQFLTISGQPDKGLEHLKTAIELEPNFFLSHLFAANAYNELGMYDRALDEAKNAVKLSGGNTEAIAMTCYLLARSGRGEEAQGVLNDLKHLSQTKYVPPFSLALAYLGVGDRDAALDWLERGLDLRDPKMVFVVADPRWNGLRQDPRFIALLDRMKVPSS